jgi:hypothetical protein
MWLAFGAAVAIPELGAPLWAREVSGGPMLVVSDQAVTATGMTPGGTVVWLGMGRKAVEYEATFVRRRGSLQADSRGQVQVPLTEAVPPQSIWAAIDLASGAYATASPAGFTPLILTLGPEAFELRGTGFADRLADVADYAEVLLVRPGQGAWGKAIGRGGADDESNPGDVAFRLAFDRLEPFPGTTAPAPDKLSAKDLIFVLHPQAMALAVVSFGGRP